MGTRKRNPTDEEKGRTEEEYLQNLAPRCFKGFDIVLLQAPVGVIEEENVQCKRQRLERQTSDDDVSADFICIGVGGAQK
jgi:hypothetical protein